MVARQPAMSSWGHWAKEQLVREKTFRSPPPDGPVDRAALARARCIMLFFYIGFGGVLVYMIWYVFLAGRVEVMTTNYKQDIIEAPSIAICPFNAGTGVIFPAGVPEEQAVQVLKFGLKGEERLATKTKICEFDRICACVDLFAVPSDEPPHDMGIFFHDHLQEDTKQLGTSGQKSKKAMAFRERIEVRTNITEPSSDKTLKVGFYDSADQVPQWTYMAQESFCIGSLELQTWTVSDLTFTAMWKTIKAMLGRKDGDLKATFSQRHIYRYTSQEVPGSVQSGIASYVSYEMRHFFVDDTVSSETAISPYSLLFLCVLIAVRAGIRAVFVSVMFPVYDPHANKDEVRELSWYAETTTHYFGCCACGCLGGDEEKEPLVEKP